MLQERTNRLLKSQKPSMDRDQDKLMEEEKLIERLHEKLRRENTVIVGSYDQDSLGKDNFGKPLGIYLV